MRKGMRPAVGALSVLCINACSGGGPSATPATLQPLITGSSSPVSVSPAPTALPGSPATAVESASPSDTFREDFEGAALDPAKWASFEQNGFVLVRDGKMDLFSLPKATSFPYIVTKDIIVPQKGPWYFEMAYRPLTIGSTVSFCLDYLPPATPQEEPLTQPFLAATMFYSDLGLVVKTESEPNKFYRGTKGVVPNMDHRFRVESDGTSRYRLIVDQNEVSTFESRRRPQKFWIGAYPLKDGAQDWPRLVFDYVASGPLTTPDPAPPYPAVAPDPAPAPTLAPVASASPVAS